MSLFDQQTVVDVTIPENAYETLVGEGKKYKDQETLAKSSFHKDQHIARLEQEAKERAEITQQLQDQLRAQKKTEDLLDKIQSTINQPPKAPDQPEVLGVQPAQQEYTPEQLNALLDEKLDTRLQQREKAGKQNANLAVVEAKLVEVFGNQSVARIKQEADKIGVSVEFLKSVAADNPQAFFRLVGMDTPPAKDAGVIPPRAAVESSGFRPNMTTERTETYYKLMRKTDPARYASPAVQIQKHKDALRLGENYFDA